jgi:hypothetical protein
MSSPGCEVLFTCVGEDIGVEAMTLEGATRQPVAPIKIATIRMSALKRMADSD